MNELAQVILTISQTVDDGVVVFFPSYAYEELVYADWQRRGLLAEIEVTQSIDIPIPLSFAPGTVCCTYDHLGYRKRSAYSVSLVDPSKST